MSAPSGTRPLRVGLVLGGGAVKGAAWLEGALAALADETGWSPRSAEVLVGTSAGSWLATLLAAGVPPWLLAAQTAGERIDGLVPGPRAPRAPRVSRTQQLAALRLGGSPELLARSLLRPLAYPPTRLWAGWAPRGVRPSGVQELVRALVPEGWPDHPALWCVAVDYRSGRRVVLGRDPQTPPDVADAVAASCAIPVVFAPVRIGGRDYVDGGLHSVSNLDLLAGHGLDLVICCNPTSSLDVVAARSPAELAFGLIRGTVGPRLGREARKVRDEGTEVLLLQPTREDLEVLGTDWMRPRGLREVVTQARRSVRRQLAETPLRDLLDRLPAGPAHEVRRPEGPQEAWPALVGPPSWFPIPAAA